MSKNHIGTIFRIFLVFISLVSFWSSLLGLFYFIISTLFNMPFSFIGYIPIFVGFIFYRMIYLKY